MKQCLGKLKNKSLVGSGVERRGVDLTGFTLGQPYPTLQLFGPREGPLGKNNITKHINLKHILVSVFDIVSLIPKMTGSKVGSATSGLSPGRPQTKMTNRHNTNTAMKNNRVEKGDLMDILGYDLKVYQQDFKSSNSVLKLLLERQYFFPEQSDLGL